MFEQNPPNHVDVRAVPFPETGAGLLRHLAGGNAAESAAVKKVEPPWAGRIIPFVPSFFVTPPPHPSETPSFLEVRLLPPHVCDLKE